MPQITIVNNTNELVRVAIYKKPVLQPTLSTIAWQIVAPPPGGQTIVPTPESYEVYAEYSLDPNDPDPTSPSATLNQTNTVSFNEPMARFQIVSVTSQDKGVTGAYIHQVFTDLMENEVRLENNFGIGVLSHIQKDGVDILAPQVLLPGGVRIEDVRSTLYLAVVDADPGRRHRRGDRLHVERLFDHCVVVAAHHRNKTAWDLRGVCRPRASPQRGEGASAP